MSELYRFAYHLAEGVECNQCDEPFEYHNLKFQPSQKSYDLEASYQCQSCSTDYLFLVEDMGHGVDLEIYRDDQDIVDEHAVTGTFRQKSSLHEDLHPARDLVEAIFELGEIRGILEVNKDRITEAVEEIREPQGLRQPDEFHQQLDADIHNYLSSAYSFSQILSTVEGDLPTDGPVESKLEDFKDEERVITGLRTYVQHHLTLPTSFTRYLNPNTGAWRTSVTVKIEDVNEIESDKDRYSPDGYAHPQGAEHHYGDVDLDLIDIELHVLSHFNAAESLVSVIYSHAGDVRGDDLEEYAEKTDYQRYFDAS